METHEINLKQLCTMEYLLFRDSYENEFLKTVISFLRMKNSFITEGTTINDKTIEELAYTLGYRYICLGTIKGADKPHRAYVDLWADCNIVPDGYFYNQFICYALRQLELQQIDAFLEYHLETYFYNDIKTFSRLLTVSMRQYAEMILSSGHVLTIEEWIKDKALVSKASIGASIDVKTKGKPKRQADDKLTVLNQEQTALLGHFLKEARFIFRDEYLNNKEAGLALSMLTGYSAETLRQTLSKTEIGRINTKENLLRLHGSLTRLTNLIENDLRKIKVS